MTSLRVVAIVGQRQRCLGFATMERFLGFGSAQRLELAVAG